MAVPAETMAVPAETMAVPAETSVSLHKPKNVPTVFYCGKANISVYAGTMYEIV